MENLTGGTPPVRYLLCVVPCKLYFIAIIGMIAFVIIEFTGLDTPGSVYERVAGAGLGLDCGMLIVLAMYLSGLLGKIKARREMKRKYNCK